MLDKLSRLKVPVLPRRAFAAICALTALALLIALWLASGQQTFDLFQTRGQIANRERTLLIFSMLLAALVLVPVYYMLYTFAWRYKTGHDHKYSPNWDTDKKYETIWWGIPIAIITVLAAVTWVTSHSLDPYKPLNDDRQHLKVQVIALQYKWLFLYPDQEVASVNKLVIPNKWPIELDITSDAPMNSFWVPQLSGQIYAMPGMSTKLHLDAQQRGTFKGMSSNISGADFSKMNFTVESVGIEDFKTWVTNAKQGGHFTADSYTKLAKPGGAQPATYHLHDKSIYDNAIMKYMGGHQ